MKDMTLEDAKKLFISSNYSKFVMGRENPSGYQMYVALNISKEIENEWRQEQLIKYYDMMKLEDSQEKKWVIYNQMYDLVGTIKSQDSIKIMEQTTKYLVDKLNQKERVIVAETIIGRKSRSCRSGLIYLSFDLGDTTKAKIFANFALDLLNISDNESLQNRINNAKTTCIEIMDELSIEAN